MPANIDMQLIQEAMARRRSGDIRVPPTGQATLPGAPTPGGGPNVPIEATPTPQATPGAPAGIPAGTPARTDPNILGGLQAGQTIKGSPNVDDETKEISKVLIAKLLKLL